MEGDEMEMTKEELQKWIRQKVTKNKLISTDILEKCSLLQSLLQRRENQAAHLLKLCETVAECEAVVRKQYSLLGLEYRDADSDDDNETGCGNTPPSPPVIVDVETKVPLSPTTNGSTPLLPKLEDNENFYRDNGKKIFVSLKRQPVVVVTRLPPSTISSLCPPTPENHNSEDESLNNLDSDTQWEHDDDDDDDDSSSEYSISSYNTGSNKRRKIDQKSQKLVKSPAILQASTNAAAKRNTAKRSTPQVNANNKAKSNAAKRSTPQVNANNKAKSNAAKRSTPQANANNKAKKTLTLPANTNGVTPVTTGSSLCQSSDEATKTTSIKPEGEIRVNMNVLARRRAMVWQQGKIMEIVTKEDGRLKYKISFEEKGKSLVSGHHIAFDCMPKVEQMFVGARVVVNCKAEKPRFYPGVLAELPNRKNSMRFLVFTDRHAPIYVGLPLLHLVCRPLADPLDDIFDDFHKNFMKEYLKVWPHPPQTQYRIGQTINAELNGVQESCEVQVVDCSLIQVVFQRDQHKEWIYRGSTRLEHMINMREHLELKRQKNRSITVNESSKLAH